MSVTKLQDTHLRVISGNLFLIKADPTLIMMPIKVGKTCFKLRAPSHWEHPSQAQLYEAQIIAM